MLVSLDGVTLSTAGSRSAALQKVAAAVRVRARMIDAGIAMYR